MKKKGGGMFLPVMIDMLKPQEIILKLSTNPFNKGRGGQGRGDEQNMKGSGNRKRNKSQMRMRG